VTGWDQVGGNPSPGEVATLRDQVRQLLQVSENGRDVEGRLRELHHGMVQLRWQGAGATAMAGVVSDTVPDLVKFWTAHGEAGRALAGYTDGLEARQAQAAAALAQFSAASDAASAADRAIADAGTRQAAAQRSVDCLDVQITTTEGRRLAAVAARQPTAAWDAELASLRSRRNYQAGLRDEAQSDRAASIRRRDSATTQLSQAKRTIDQIRHEVADDAQRAASAILASVGVVRSRNPLVRAWDDAVHDTDIGLKWFSDNLLDSWDQALGRLSLLALAIAPIPGLDVLDAPLSAVIGTMAAISAVGHLYRAANGQESLLHAGVAVLEAVPVGRALGTLSHTDAAAFDNLPGIAKRLASFDNASYSKGFLSSHGIHAFGRVIYRVHVVPKPIGSVLVTRPLLVAKATQIVARTIDKADTDLRSVENAVGLRHDHQPQPSKEDRAEQVITILLKHRTPAPTAIVN
jgi:hypothetical protein